MAAEGYSPRTRVERIIAAGRLFLAAFLAVAIVLGPTEPRPYAWIVFYLAFGYLAYAGAVALLVAIRRASTPTISYGTHAIDLVLFAVFLHLTGGRGSAFFVCFTFGTMAGALRWHGLGAALTGIGGLAVFFLVLISDLIWPRQPDFQLTTFIGRSAQLGIVTMFVSYLASYHHRLERELARLAAWPRLSMPEADAIHDLLEYAAGVLRASGIIFVWQERGDSSLRVAKRQGDRVEMTLESPDAFGGLVAAPLRTAPFLCSNAGAKLPMVVYRSPDGYQVWRGAPFTAAFQDRFRVKSVVAVRLEALNVKGWMFALGRSWTSSDDIRLAEIVSRIVGGALELRTALEQLRDAAAGEERLRLARELHDGVLQSLTAASLQAQRARHVLARDPMEAVRRLSHVEDTILAAHQALRASIIEMRPGTVSGSALVDCGDEVREAATRIARQWDISVLMDVAPGLARVPRRVAHELVRMTQEALANAVRHGGAREVTVSLGESSGELHLAVRYTGRGFTGFTGSHDIESLDAMKAGPRSLKERVSGLGGSLVIDSNQAGVKIEIAVPAYQAGRSLARQAVALTSTL